MNSPTDDLKKQEGSVIVEASIVFPVMFLVLFFIIYFGNMYYQISQVDNMAMSYAIKGAQSVADPFHYEMETEGRVPFNDKVEPYRYILGEINGASIDTLETKIQEEIKEEFNTKLISFFKNMNPTIDGNVDAEFNNYVLYGTFHVEIKYSIPFPLRLWGSNNIKIAHLSSKAEVSVNDTTEFVRNTDMILDIFEVTAAGQRIQSYFEKINEFISQFGER